MTFPGDRHPDYYDGLREGALALRDAIRARPAYVSADFAPDYCLINIAASANAAEQAMRAAQERAMAGEGRPFPAPPPLVYGTPAEPRFPQGDGEVAELDEMDRTLEKLVEHGLLKVVP